MYGLNDFDLRFRLDILSEIEGIHGLIKVMADSNSRFKSNEKKEEEEEERNSMKLVIP